MPVLFIGHGSPMNIVLDNGFTRALAAAGRELPRPRSILVVSAHWLTRGTFVSADTSPRQIYDFYGFPDELYRVRYACPGAPEDARAVAKLLAASDARPFGEWGLDHAAWAVLVHMYPEADVPVFEMSLDIARGAQYHYELAAGLKALRMRGVLVLASGNLVHNLGLMDYERMDAAPFPWARRADEVIRDFLLAGDHRSLIDFPGHGEHASLAVPTPDHYLPLMYALALQEKGEPLTFLHEGTQHGSVSMRSLRIG